MQYTDEWNMNECHRIIHENIDEMRRISKYPEWELDHEFLGFLSEYAQLPIPKDFVVIDLGCNHGIQGVYFKEHPAYVGVDIGIPSEWRMQHGNEVYFDDSIQNFIRYTLPELGIDESRCFAICSYVPDEEAQQLVAETFPYHKVVYCDELISERLPDMELEEER